MLSNKTLTSDKFSVVIRRDSTKQPRNFPKRSTLLGMGP